MRATTCRLAFSLLNLRRARLASRLVGKNDNGVRWLYAQLPELSARGIVDEPTAAALRQHYGTPALRTGVSLLVGITAVLASLLIGAGIILLLAANWDSFPRVVRTALAFIPLLVSHALGAFVLLRKMDSIAWRESVAVLNSLAVATAIALVSQIYQIGGDFRSVHARLDAVDAAGHLPAALGGGDAALPVARDGLDAERYERALGLGVAAVLAALPMMVPMMMRGGLRAWWLAMAAMISSGILLGVTTQQAHLHGLWIPTFAGYFTLLYVAGVALRPDELHPFRWLGFAAIGILSLIFTYGGFWDYSQRRRNRIAAHARLRSLRARADQRDDRRRPRLRAQYTGESVRRGLPARDVTRLHDRAALPRRGSPRC